MAENKSKSNKVPKLSEVIKSTLSNIKEITDATKVIVGSVEDLAKLIPDDFDQNVKNIQNNLLKGVESIDKMVKVFTSIDSGIKLNLKSLLTMRFKIKILKQYIYLFMQMFETMAFYVNQGEQVGKQLDRFKNSAFAGLEKQIELINNIELSTVTTKMLMARIFIKEFKSLTEYLINTLSSIYYDEFYKEYIDHIVENTKDIIDNMNSSIVALDDISITKMIMNKIKIPLMKENIQSLLEMQISLSDKINKRKLEGIKDRLNIINDITNSLYNIFDNIDKVKNRKFNAKRLNRSIDSIINIVDSLDQLNEKLSKTNLKSLQIKPILETIEAIYKIEKRVILISLISLPFAAAAILMVAGVTIGMTAILLMIRVIMLMANPALLRLARMSMKNLYKTILYIAYVVTTTILTIILILASATFIVEHIKAILISIAVIGIIILAIAAVGYLVGLASTGLTAFALGMTILAVAVIALIGVVLLLKLITKIKFTEDDSEQVKQNVKNILGAAGAVINEIFKTFDNPMGTEEGEDGIILTLLGYIGGDMLVNVIKLVLSCMSLVFTVIAIGLVFLTALTLTSLLNNSIIISVINNKNQIINNVKEILGTSRDVINAIFDVFENPIGEEGDGALLWIASQVLGDAFVNTFKLIISCIALTFTIIAISLVRITAWSLSLINDIKIDRDKINSNAQTIMGAARDVIAAVNAPTDGIKPAEKSIGRHIIEAILPASLVNMIDAIMAIGALGPTVLAVGAVGFMARQLNEIQKLEVGSDINERAKNIIAIGSSIVKIVNDSNEFKGVDTDDVIERASAIKLVAEAINELGKDVNVETHNTLTKNAGELINIFKDFKIDNYAKFADNSIKLIDKIDNSKLENLQTAHNMFKEMKEFSESISGNFDGLAEALNEKIAPLLEELKGLIEKIPESVDKSASTISTSMYNTTSIANGTANTSTMTQQVQSENPTMSKEEVNRMVDQRMNQQAQSVNKGIEMKLEELIDVLQNYSNPIPVRMS